MRTYEEICKIVENMDYSLFEKLNNVDSFERFALNNKIHKNAMAKIKRYLKKAGLSLDEWDMWVSI